MKYSFSVEGESEELQTLEQYWKGPDAHAVLEDVVNRVFRPARKHGYAQKALTDFIASCSDSEVDKVLEFTTLLEAEFWEIVRDRGLEL